MQVRMNFMRKRNSITRLQVQQVHPHDKRLLEKDHEKTSGQEKLLALLADEF